MKTNEEELNEYTSRQPFDESKQTRVQCIKKRPRNKPEDAEAQNLNAQSQGRLTSVLASFS